MARQIYQGRSAPAFGLARATGPAHAPDRPSGVVGMVALGMVLAAVLVWACFGTVRVTVEARASSSAPAGCGRWRLPARVVCQLPAQAGERVAAGQELCRLAPTGGAGCDQPVHAPSRPGSWTSPSTKVRLSSQVRRW